MRGNHDFRLWSDRVFRGWKPLLTGICYFLITDTRNLTPETSTMPPMDGYGGKSYALQPLPLIFKSKDGTNKTDQARRDIKNNISALKTWFWGSAHKQLALPRLNAMGYWNNGMLEYWLGGMRSVFIFMVQIRK
jgi:hypothetical protein